MPTFWAIRFEPHLARKEISLSVAGRPEMTEVGVLLQPLIKDIDPAKIVNVLAEFEGGKPLAGMDTGNGDWLLTGTDAAAGFTAEADVPGGSINVRATVIYDDDLHSGQTGYLVRDGDGSVRIYYEDGTLVPDEPAYSYTTVDTNPPLPAWANDIAAPPSPPTTPIPPLDPNAIVGSVAVGDYMIFQDGNGLNIRNPDGTVAPLILENSP